MFTFESNMRNNCYTLTFLADYIIAYQPFASVTTLPYQTQYKCTKQVFDQTVNLNVKFEFNDDGLPAKQEILLLYQQ